jgi:CRISPR-associated protein Csb2
VARFALDAPVLPLITEAVPVAEAFRSGLLTHYKRVVRRRLDLPREAGPATHPELCSPTLSGKVGGEMIAGSHDHAYYLPTDEDGDGRIDHVTLIAEGGLDEDEVKALDVYRKLPLGEGELRLQLVGLGDAEAFRCPLFERSAVWESATPFVVNRHVKPRGRKRDPVECHGLHGRREFALRVLKEELDRLRQRRPELPPAEAVALSVQPRIGRGTGFRPLEFRRGRNRPGDDGMARATLGVRLRFSEPVAGPLCLGYAAHFGLGLFLPPG